MEPNKKVTQDSRRDESDIEKTESVLASTLRERAEKLLEKVGDDLSEIAVENAKKLVHELQVHQIELELQNEELRSAQNVLEESRDNYSDLYDFAPVGYLTLDPDGVILEANLTLSTLLAINREELIGNKLAHFIVPEDQDVLYLHRQAVFTTGIKQVCEIRIRKQDQEGLFARLESLPVPDTEGNITRCRIILSDITEQKQAEKKKQLLMAELDHRTKNMFTLVLVIAKQLLRETSSFQAFEQVFEAQIMALSKAHSLLAENRWEGVFIDQLIKYSTEAYRQAGTLRVIPQGGPIVLNSKLVEPLFMTFCELAVNSAKYGALSVQGGRVDLKWEMLGQDSREGLRFQWIESGGPRVGQPGKKGFGTRLIEQLIVYELSGQVQTDFRESGLYCEIRMPFPSDNHMN